MDNPTVSVMTVAKGNCLFLDETIKSVMEQTLTDFEWIFIDGGIDEPAKKILMQNASSDNRLKVFSQLDIGLSQARNQALAICRGKFCAVIDSDDQFLPNKLEKQVDFLEKHSKIGICGSWIKTIGANCDEVFETPVNDAAIRSLLVFNNPFAHSSVMWRRKDIQDAEVFYELDSAEDYHFWLKLSKFVQFANIPEVLVRYRIHADQLSKCSEKNALERNNLLLIRRIQILALAIEATDQDFDIHQKLAEGKFLMDDVFVKEAEVWLIKLQKANHQRQIYPEEQFNQILANLWWSVCLEAKSTRQILKRFLCSPLNLIGYGGVKRKISFMLRYLNLA